jgi:hypothetical protein
VYGYLFAQQGLQLTPIEAANATGCNYVWSLELAPPSKAAALAHLDGGAPPPPRYALAVVIEGAARPPRVTQARVVRRGGWGGVGGG